MAQASRTSTWQVVCSLGGDTGYFCMDGLWWLRGFAGWLIGGRGLSRGRRHPTELRLGDRIDYWTVLGIEPGRRLTLQFGMRSPGSGVLELEVTPESSAPPAMSGVAVTDAPTCRITVTAHWHPQGVWGLLYCYALVPAHLFIFKGMTTGLARRAQALEQRTRGAGHAA